MYGAKRTPPMIGGLVELVVGGAHGAVAGFDQKAAAKTPKRGTLFHSRAFYFDSALVVGGAVGAFFRAPAAAVDPLWYGGLFALSSRGAMSLVADQGGKKVDEYGGAGMRAIGRPRPAMKSAGYSTPRVGILG